MKIREITACIEELCPLAHAEDFDNVGLLVGDADNEVSGILVSLDCLEATVEEAIENNCNLIPPPITRLNLPRSTLSSLNALPYSKNVER